MARSARQTVTENAPGPTVTTTLQMPSANDPAAKPETLAPPEPLSFWEKQASIPKADWENNCVIYVYRLGHATRALGSGEKGYLDVLSEAITPDYIKRRWGGGRFRIMLIRNSTLFAKTEEDIEGQPVYEHREAPANGNGAAAAATGEATTIMQQFITVLREELAHSRQTGPNPATDEAIKLLSNASDRAMDVITKQVPQAGDPTAQMTALIAAAEKLSGLRQAPSDGGFGKLVELLLPLVPELLKKMLNPVDPLEQITKYSALFELVEKIRGPRDAGTPVDSRTAIVQAISENAPQLLKTWDDVSVRNLKAAEERRVAEEARQRNLEMFGKLSPAQREELRNSGGRRYVQEAGRAAAPAPAANPKREEAAAAAAPAVESAPVAAGADITQEQFDEMVKRTVVQLVVSGANPETVVDYLYSTKPDVCKQIAKNPNAVIKMFFSNDPVLKVLVTHVTQTESGDEDFDALIDAAREYIKACEEDGEDQAAKPN